MQRHAFGQTGLEVPVLGFGAMQAGDPRLSEAHAARERLRTDLIDIVHLHSCSAELLDAGDVAEGRRCAR